MLVCGKQRQLAEKMLLILTKLNPKCFFLITSYVDTSEGNRHYKFNERKFPTKCLKTFLLKVCSKVS